MASTLADIEALTRIRLIEPVPKFWSSDELIGIIIAGIKDLWRDIVNLKQEHYLTLNTSVTYPSNSIEMAGVPNDIHKIYMIEPLNGLETGPNVGLKFQPLEYNHPFFQQSRTMTAVDPSSTTIYYSVAGQGAPDAVTRILCAPKVTGTVAISFMYIPTLSTVSLSKEQQVPVPGEVDNALVAWTVAYARAKEREDRSPDPGWLTVYATEKQHILESLGIRQYQEPKIGDALFEEYWA